MILTLDAETHDPLLSTLGSGWVHGQLTVLGFSYKINNGTTKFTPSRKKITNLVNRSSTIIAHNLQYDVGILLMWGIDISKKLLIDTMVLAKLENNVRVSYSLDNLSKKLLKKTKSDVPLGLAVLRHRLVPFKDKRSLRLAKKDLSPEDMATYIKAYRTRIIKKAINFAKTNMHTMMEIVPDLVIKYANQDVDLAYELYTKLIDKVPPKWVKKVSRLYKVLLKCRQKGVPIDVKRLHEVRTILSEYEQGFLQQMMHYVPSELENFNPGSTAQIAQILDNEGISYLHTDKGNPSITSGWIDNQGDDAHPFLLALRDYRKYNKARRDFCDTVLEAQRLLPLEKRGNVYPEFRIFGALTGRFSCANPNIQQIPARDAVIGPLIRSIYIPRPGTKLGDGDFSSQESRLQVHYAKKVEAEGANLLVQEYVNNPRLDLHQTVADLARITRSDAKVINLGLSYGMGGNKLARSLGVTNTEAKELTKKYHQAMPFLDELNAACKRRMQRKGYIRTLGGRKSYMDKPTWKDGKEITFEYKALNKLIQGSAADQMIEAMIQLDKAGIDLLISVHDEILFCFKEQWEVDKVKEIMETCVKLHVPMVTDIGVGKNWAEAK